ncbi:MAG: efflux RND transporter periplasmic adaptor subunit [Salinivirgaceae bacterium]|nr:efflux RND transporter periplasmic adaptor subunit [Salinivirgaceae bacterium]
MRNIFYISLLAIGYLFAACTNNSVDGNKETTLADDQISITKQQFEHEGMEIGNPEIREFSKSISCNGLIKPTINGIAQVSLPMSGTIESISYNLGSKLSKGQILFSVSSMEFIQLQQQYIEAKAKLEYVNAEYERKKDLYNEKIGSEKELKAAESEFLSIQSQYHSFKLQLEKLNIDLAQIDGGKIYKSFSIKAPINGTLTKQFAVLGQFVEQNQSLAEIINSNELQLEIAIFQDDISEIEKGDAVLFSLSGDLERSFKTEIQSIGKALNQNTKTITCLAKLEANNQFISGLMVPVHIITDSKELWSLPNEALVKDGDSYFVYLIEKEESEQYLVKKVEINIGAKNKSFIEVINEKDFKNVIVKGIYNL